MNSLRLWYFCLTVSFLCLWKIAWCLSRRMKLLHWMLKSSIMNFVRFHLFIASSMKGFYLFNCLALFIYVFNIKHRLLLWMIWSQLTCFTLLYDQDYVGSMSPQKLSLCYRLPTRGRVGTKLGDAWYVQHVSIIFDVPCLLYIDYHMIILHFISFLCIF